MPLFQCFSFISGGIKEHVSHILKHKCSLCKYAEIEARQPEQRDYTLMMDSVQLGNLLLHIHEKSLMHTVTFRLLRVAIESLSSALAAAHGTRCHYTTQQLTSFHLTLAPTNWTNMHSSIRAVRPYSGRQRHFFLPQGEKKNYVHFNFRL